jgi:hypothetical protein
MHKSMFISFDLKCFWYIYLMFRRNIPLQYKFLILYAIIWIKMCFACSITFKFECKSHFVLCMMGGTERKNHLSCSDNEIRRSVLRHVLQPCKFEQQFNFWAPHVPPLIQLIFISLPKILLYLKIPREIRKINWRIVGSFNAPYVLLLFMS